MKLNRARFVIGVPIAGFVVTAVDATALVELTGDPIGVRVRWQGATVTVPWANVVWASNVPDAEPAPTTPRARTAK
jgi:hypothetical protein